jgi:hypothetical protein
MGSLLADSIYAVDRIRGKGTPNPVLAFALMDGVSDRPAISATSPRVAHDV